MLLLSLLVVYDNAHLHLVLPDAEDERRLAQSEAFAEADSELDSRGRVRAAHRGMRLRYDPKSRFLLVQGSLHTFAQGHNAGVFTAPEVATACRDLAGALDMPPEWLTVHKLEVGVNLPVADSPRAFLESLASHKNAPFTALKPPAGATRPLEYNAYHAAYRVKAYNKGEYNRLQGRYPPSTAAPHLLRYELVFERMRPMCTVTGLSLITLAELPRPPVMAAFAAHLRAHWKLTQRHDPMNYTGLSVFDAALLHAANDVAFWKAMQQGQPRNTYSRNRAKAKALLLDRAEPHPYDATFARELAYLTQFAPTA